MVAAATAAVVVAVFTASMYPPDSSSRIRTTPAERSRTTEASQPETGGSGPAPASPSTGNGAPAGDARRRMPAVGVPVPTVPKMPTTTAPAPSRPASRDAEIAFNRGRRVWVMNADGSGAAPLTDASRRVNDGDWSPDGRRLVAVDWRSDATGMPISHLTLIELDGSLHPLTEEGGFGRPEWSPDGRHIAFLMDVSPGWSAPENDLWVMKADGTGRRKLAESVGLSYSWSPDGQRIAYECGGICTIKADGTDRRVIPGTSWDRDPAWSSAGRLAVNMRDEADGYHLKVAVVNLDGTDRRILAERWFTHEMDWSPDGRTLVYSAQVESDYDGDPTHSCAVNCPVPESTRIWRVDADGSNRVAITPGDDGSFRPSWRPKR